MSDETVKKKSTPEEQIAKLTEKIEQLKRQKQAIANREKEILRKQRTRRLIENGALAEKYLNAESFSSAEFENLLKRIVYIPEVISLIRKESPNVQNDNNIQG